MLPNGEFPLLPEIFEPHCVWGARIGGGTMIRRLDLDLAEAVFLLFGFFLIGVLIAVAI
jgi:hypothetical protein